MHTMTSPLPLSEEIVHELPKVLLHDHLDGGLRPATIIELAADCGYGDLPTTDPAQLKQWFFDAANSGSLPKYLETFAHTCAVMQTAQAIERVACEAVEDLAADNVIYAELRFAPEQHQEAGLTLQEVVDAAVRGVDKGVAVVADMGKTIYVRLILCGMRHAERTAEIAQLMVDNYQPGGTIAGYDIAGAEDGFLPSKHAEAFALLRENFVPFTIHAGEAAGLESLESAVRQGTCRIGHGVRIYEDISADISGITLGRMASYVCDRRIPLELCPTSNVQTGVVDNLLDHPFPLLYELGFSCTVNTDNRLVSDTTMTKEMMVLVDAFDFGLGELYELTLNAIRSAFIPQQLREEIIGTLIDPAYEELLVKHGFASEDVVLNQTGNIAPNEDHAGGLGQLTQDDLDAIDPQTLADLGIDLKDLGLDNQK